MPDYGGSFWALDDVSGTTVVDSVSTHNGVYSDTSHISYRLPAPSLTGFGVGLRQYRNGNPWYSSPLSAPSFGVALPDFGSTWGSMYGTQPFTISTLLRWHGPTLGVGYAGGPGALGTLLYVPGRYGVGLVSGRSPDDPYHFTFYRGSSSITATVDIPAGLDFNVWDDYAGGLYQEPIKTAQWMSFVIRYTGLRKSIWIDGVKVAEDAADDTASIITGFPSQITFNATANFDWSETALFHHALDDSEIAAP